MKALKSLDLEQTIGQVTLSDGKTKLDIPKLSASRLIKIVKFLGVEVARIWESAKDVAYDGSYSDQEKLIQILEIIPEEKLLGIISILTDLDEESSLALDLNEILDILLVFVEKTNVSKTFLQIQTLYEKVFNKKMPKISELLKIPEQDQIQAEQKETDGKTA